MPTTALVSSASATIGAGTRLFVETDGFGAGCTSHQPCGSIQTAVDVASAGDTIRIGRGEFYENVFVETSGLTFRGAGDDKTTIVSAGGRDGAVGNAGNPLDAIFEVRAPDLTITGLRLVHPSGDAVKRDAAVFAWPGSDGLLVERNHIERLRDSRTDEPTTPGSRGVFILLSPTSEVSRNNFEGNYQDHVHLPTGGVLVERNEMTGAFRAGISVMDPDQFPDFPAFDNVIQHNRISDSLDDGIHIQGDRNTIRRNHVFDNGGFGIYLCGDHLDCYPPGANAVSEGNIVGRNTLRNNTQGEVGDFGVGNIVNQ